MIPKANVERTKEITQELRESGASTMANCLDQIIDALAAPVPGEIVLTEDGIKTAIEILMYNCGPTIREDIAAALRSLKSQPTPASMKKCWPVGQSFKKSWKGGDSWYILGACPTSGGRSEANLIIYKGVDRGCYYDGPYPYTDRNAVPLPDDFLDGAEPVEE